MPLSAHLRNAVPGQICTALVITDDPPFCHSNAWDDKDSPRALYYIVPASTAKGMRLWRLLHVLTGTEPSAANCHQPSHFAVCSACSKGCHGKDFGTPAGWTLSRIPLSLQWEAAMSLTKPSLTGNPFVEGFLNVGDEPGHQQALHAL